MQNDIENSVLVKNFDLKENVIFTTGDMTKVGMYMKLFQKIQKN